MKIGFFTDSYTPSLDGVATTVESCAKELERLGHEVIIIAPKYPNTKDRKNVIRIFSLRVTSQLETRIAIQIPQRSLLKIIRHDFDVIHGHSGGFVTFLGWQIAKLYGTPYVATYHTFWNKYTHYFLKGVIRPKFIELTSTLFGNVCDTLIAPTQKVKNELRAYGIRKPIYVIPSGIDLKRFEKQPKGFLRKKYSLPKEAKIALCVCRLGKEKSVDFLVKSFKDVVTQDENAYLIIVGTGPEKENLENLAKYLQISTNVIFTGPIPHHSIPKVYADADIFVFASRTETQGMVILEAMASSIPVVAVYDNVFKEVVIDNVNGFLIKKKSEGFVKHVQELLANDQLRKKLGENAQKTAEKYSIHETAVTLVKLYENMIQNRELQGTSWRDSMTILKSDLKDAVKLYGSPLSKVYVNMKELNRIKNYIRRTILS